MGNEIAVVLLLSASAAAVQHSESLRVDKSLRSVPSHSRPLPFVNDGKAVPPPVRERRERDSTPTVAPVSEPRDLPKDER